MLAINVSSITPALGASRTFVASWYGPGFVGKPMKNGKPFNPADCSIAAAHREWPIGTRFTLWNKEKGPEARWLPVIVQDRGPFVPGRDLDLSRCAAKFFGYIDKGTARLTVFYDPRHKKRAAF